GQLRVFDPRNHNTIAHLGVGKVIGEYGMFVEHRRTFSARAEGTVRLWVISYPVLHRFLLAFPESVFALMRQTVTRLLDAIDRSAVPGGVGERRRKPSSSPLPASSSLDAESPDHRAALRP